MMFIYFRLVLSHHIFPLKTIHLAHKRKWMITRTCRLVLLFLLLVSLVEAQIHTDSLIRVNGSVSDGENAGRPLEDLMVVNLTTQQGDFGKAGGLFSITIRKKDTLLIAS